MEKTMKKTMEKTRLMKITFTAVMAALAYVVFTFLQIKIPLPGGTATSFHLGNAVCTDVLRMRKKGK